MTLLWTTRNTYDLILLGLHWLTNEQDPTTVRPYTITSIMYAYQAAELIDNKQVKATLGDTSLCGEIRRYLALCQQTAYDLRDLDEILDDQIRSSRKHLVLKMIDPTVPFTSDRVLRNIGNTRGYSYRLTRYGRDFARKKIPRYADYITEQKFVNYWGEAREHVRKDVRLTREFNNNER